MFFLLPEFIESLALSNARGHDSAAHTGQDHEEEREVQEVLVSYYCANDPPGFFRPEKSGQAAGGREVNADVELSVVVETV